MNENDERPQTSVVRQEFNAVVESQFHETAASAIAAQVKAMVEARCVIAMKMGRSWPNVRSAILHQCKDPEFATEALYAKPVGRVPDGWQTMSKREQLVNAPSNWPRGFSIRMIEAVIAEAGHFDTRAVVTWEDELKRITDVTIWDLQKNNVYQRTVITSKTVERKKKPANADEILGERLNSFNQMVYTVAALPAEVDLAEASGVSKAIRTMGERLIPPQYKREWEEAIELTLRKADAGDPDKEKKRIMDVFFQYGVSPAELEEFLGHPMSGVQPAEVVQLRAILVSISQGDATWREVMELQKHARDEDHELSEGAKRVQERIAKQTSQKDKMAEQAAKAKAEADAEKAKGQSASSETSSATPKAETKPATEPESSSSSTEKQEVTEGSWGSREEMKAAFRPLIVALGDSRAWDILGSEGIDDEEKMGHEDPITIKAFRSMKIEVEESKPKDNVRPTFGKPKDRK